MVRLFIAVRVHPGWRPAESRRLPDCVFVQSPKAVRPHESFVVEACTQQAGEEPGHRPNVEAYGGPAILAEGFEPLFDLDGRGRRVGLSRWAAPHLHQRVSLLDAKPDDTSRPMILQAAGNDSYAVG